MKLGRLQVPWGKAGRQKATLGQLQAANTLGGALGLGNEWAPESYGNYYATSVPAYRAVKLRADAVASAPLKVYQRSPSGEPVQVAGHHPVQVLLDKVNPWWTASDIWKATETYLSLWGSAYWWLEKRGAEVVAIWPLRPDKMRIIAGSGQKPNDYITGYLYSSNQTL